MKPLISIVIPTYNRARDLKRALDSVISQTYTNWEVIIVDNHSSDNSEIIVNEFNEPKFKFFKIHNHGIIAASRNLGIKNAQGEFIAFLDSDDWWAPIKLEESIKYLIGGMDLVYHELFIVKYADQKTFKKTTADRVLKKPIFSDLMIKGNGISNSSVVIRKKILDTIDGLSEKPELVAMEDYDAWLRVSKITQNFFKIPKVLGFYWAGGGNISNHQLLFNHINSFKLRYSEEILKLDLTNKIYWTNYAKGRALYLLGSYAEAEKHLELIRFTQVPKFLYLKRCLMLILIKFYNKK